VLHNLIMGSEGRDLSLPLLSWGMWVALCGGISSSIEPPSRPLQSRVQVPRIFSNGTVCLTSFRGPISTTHGSPEPSMSTYTQVRQPITTRHSISICRLPCDPSNSACYARIRYRCLTAIIVALGPQKRHHHVSNNLRDVANSAIRQVQLTAEAQKTY